jgi:peptidoglycan/xylan/chitin deacetylase (PgdA/CDA1 family)
MKTLMIHDVRREYFDLPLDQYRLTFDDGLYSQYYYLPLLENHTAPLVFFIATDFIQPGGARSMFEGEWRPYLKSKRYMYQAMIEKQRDFYMTIGEVQHLAACQNVVIGAHSHFHDVILTRTHSSKRKPPGDWKLARFAEVEDPVGKGFSIRSRLAFQGYEARDGKIEKRARPDWEDYIKKDTERCLTWFQTHLDFVPDRYCFPFNEYSGPLVTILQGFGFKHFYGARATRNDLIEPRKDIDRLLAEVERSGAGK